MEPPEDFIYLNEEFGLKIAIDEMKVVVNDQFQGIDAIKSTIRTYFSSASIILSIVASLQLFLTNIDPRYKVVHNILFGATMLLYAWMIIKSAKALIPIDLFRPIKADRTVIYRTLTHKSERDILRAELHQYLLTIEANQPVVFKLDKAALYIFRLFSAIIVLLFLLSLIPRSVI